MARRVLRLAVPERTRAGTTGQQAGLVALLVLVLALVAGGIVVLIGSGGFTGLVVGGTAAVLVGSGATFVGVLLLRPRAGRIEVETAEGRLWLPPVRPVGLLTLLALAAVAAMGPAVLLGLVVDDGLRLPALASVGALVLSAGIVPVLVAALRGAWVLPRVGLGPEGVLRASGKGVQCVPWQEVVAIDLVHDPAPRVLITSREVVPTRYLSRPSAGDRPAAGPRTRPDQLPIPVRLHGSDPELVARLLRHYARHPADRHELGTGAAEDRLAQGRLIG